MGNTLKYTTKVLYYEPRLPDGMTSGTVADLKSVPVRFSLTFHDLDQDTLDRILDATKDCGYPDIFKVERSEGVVVCHKCKKDPTVRQTLSHWSEKNIEFLKSIYCQTCLDIYLEQ